MKTSRDKRKQINISDDESDENMNPLTAGTQSEFKSEMSCEWLDQIGDQMGDQTMARVRLSHELLSHEDVPHSTDTYNGSQVVNYKTFRKCLIQDDRCLDLTPVKSESVECVALKIYDNPLYGSQRSTEEVVARGVNREVGSDFDAFGEFEEKKISLTPIKSSQKRRRR